MNKIAWSIPGEKNPVWANRFGWSLVLGLLPVMFFVVRMLTYGYLLLSIYSVLSGFIISFCAFKVRSKIMLTFGVIFVFLYLIAVVIAGVNTP